MKNLVEDLLLRIIKEREENKKTMTEKKDLKEIVLLHAGKVLAYDFCISEMQRMIDYYNKGKK